MIFSQNRCWYQVFKDGGFERLSLNKDHFLVLPLLVWFPPHENVVADEILGHSPLPLPPILPARRSHPLLRRASSSAPPCCFFIVRSGSLKPAEALLPLKEGPDGTDGGNHDSTCGDGRWGQWMKGPLVRAFSISSSSSLSSCKNKKSDLRLLLGVLGAPLAPVHVCTTDPFPYLSIKDIPVVSPLFLLSWLYL